MEANFHAPCRRIIPGAQDAVLFIHGIVATPRFFDEWIELIPESWSVHSVLLPGHGGTARDFGRTSMKAWKAHVRATIDEMAQTHQRVHIVAHSLGTLLTIRAAVENPANIADLLLWCVPVRIWPKPLPALKKLPQGLGIGAKGGMPLHMYYGIAPEWRVWRYARWIPRYLELFRESRDTRRDLPELTVPTVVLMAQKDELVSLRGVKDLQTCEGLRVRLMPGAHHHEYTQAAKAVIREEIRRMTGNSEHQ